MSVAIQSLIQSGTKLWLDSIDPDLVLENRALGVTGATSNPIIIADLIKSGRFDDRIRQLAAKGLDDSAIAWTMTDELVSDAQKVFLDVWESTHGNDGYVSFELDPLLEDPQTGPPHDERVAHYISSAIERNAHQKNRLIKVPATAAGLDSLEEMVAAGINPNVTLIFSRRQYLAARDAVWRGAQRRNGLENFKSCYSIFVSRIDVYTDKHCPTLSAQAQGMVGILNAQRIWGQNQAFWATQSCPLQQEIIFASTGTKKANDPPWKYVAALSGSDIQTNPPATNVAVAKSGVTFNRNLDHLPAESVVSEIDRTVDFKHMEQTLMEEGIAKFADPQRALLALIAQKRQSIAIA